jgi:hypothetical protein
VQERMKGARVEARNRAVQQRGSAERRETVRNSETVKQFETENQHKQEISTPRERNAEKGFRTVSEASTVSDSNERLTDKEVAEIKELKRQGMAGAIARDEVLRNRGGLGATTEWFKGSEP